MKIARRQARIDALQILYQLDLNSEVTAEKALEYFKEFYNNEKKTLDVFTEKLVLGVSQQLRKLDSIIKELSEHWKPERMAAVDRNILRLGIYELVYCQDIPATVSINEMIELAKQFSNENSPGFINGILDKVREKHCPVDKVP